MSENSPAWLADSPAELERLLERYLGLSGWEIKRPPAGSSRTTFIAKSQHKAVFLKLGVGPTYLRRLSELGITPPVLASGRHAGTSFVIQAYTPGHHPAPSWFHKHLGQVAGLMNTYHRDATLVRRLKADRRVSTARSQLAKLDQGLRQLSDSPEKTEALSLWARLCGRSGGPVTHDLAAVHPDPNHKNFIVNGATILLMDWNEIVVSDPLRDSALFSYWYLPETRWPEFLETLGIDYSEKVLDRFYWWVGARSLEVAHWFGARGHKREMASFLADTKAALARAPNPHARFSA